MSAYSIVVLEDAPVAWYRLGESGTVVPGITAAFDSSGNSDNGLYNGSDLTLGESGPIYGDPTTAVASAGSGGVFDAAEGGSGVEDYSNGRSSISLEMWVKLATPQSAGGNGLLLAGWGAGLVDTYIGTNPDGTFAFGAANSVNEGEVVSSTKTLADNAWHHVVGVFHSTGLIIYIDGASNGSSTHGASTLGSGSGVPFEISDSDAFVGSFGEVAIYPQALSAGRVLIHYQAAQMPTPTPTATGGGFRFYDV